ncbi:hypothetical protein GYMLUDRAFT_174825 [Collybiopsis luxurians FD-317 M1]|uniref:Amine oxidase n=1 Tax=Collybiopsis luxurians FD-317 M1 TaxID=944289 RepID=A0A0D0CLP5_9AGAR|nr:hypothetical protein GYMLUDRAFT_174825 [Collybiopsis luxurians FD-317 M1]
MFAFGFSFFISLLLALRVESLTDPSQYPVCIIGAGPSGLTVAHELEARGNSTVIFDSNAEVGGKCQSYYDDPIARTTYHAMGALIFTNQTYNNTLPLILEAGLPLSPALSPGPSANWNYWLYEAGAKGAQSVTKLPFPNTTELFEILVEVNYYEFLWNELFAPYSGSRYEGDICEEFTMPMKQWLFSKGFIKLPTFVELGLVYEGYGNIAQTPALYALQFLTPEILTYYLGTTPGYFVDFHKLWVWYAQNYVKGTIHSSTNVSKIDRSGEYPIVTYNGPRASSSSMQTCSSLIMAFPPTTRALKAAGLDFTDEEFDIFSNVGVTAYWAAAFKMDLPYPYAFLETPATPDFRPLAMLRYFNESTISTAYSFGLSLYNETSADSDEQVKQLLLSSANDLGTGLAQNRVGGVDSPITVSEADVKLLTRQDHFPHVLTEALQGGFYAKYNALQGQKKTYWTSGLDRFENIESAIRAAKDLVENVIF